MHLRGLREVDPERLFAHDVYASSGSCKGHWEVDVVRCRDHDGIGFRVVEHCLVVIENTGNGIPVRNFLCFHGCRSEDRDHLRQFGHTQSWDQDALCKRAYPGDRNPETLRPSRCHCKLLHGLR